MTVHTLPPAPALPPIGRTTPRALREAAEEAIVAARDNPHVLIARYRKARRVADAILASESQPSADELIAMGEFDAVRELAGKAAGANTPSAVTWALVVELVNEGRSVRRG